MSEEPITDCHQVLKRARQWTDGGHQQPNQPNTESRTEGEGGSGVVGGRDGRDH